MIRICWLINSTLPESPGSRKRAREMEREKGGNGKT